LGVQETDVLIIDDDAGFTEELMSYLRGHGLSVASVPTLRALELLPVGRPPRVIVLDQFLDGVDSLSELPRLRQLFRGGIMILTGNTEFSDQILGLELGADDLLAKSRPAREILARLRAMLRREATPAPVEPAAETRGGSGWWLDQMRRELVAPGGRVVTLTSREFDLLACLARHKGAAVSRDELYDSCSAAPIRRSVAPWTILSPACARSSRAFQTEANCCAPFARRAMCWRASDRGPSDTRCTKNQGRHTGRPQMSVCDQWPIALSNTAWVQAPSGFLLITGSDSPASSTLTVRSKAAGSR
jgi:DNA-binding response OmpR family regulator